ncbi:MAG: glycosyltransferase [Planctomycetota bacterium]
MHVSLMLFFWASLLGVIYTYAGYPLLVCVMAYWQRRNATDQGALVPDHHMTHEALPLVTVLIAAHNAEDHIADRIENILQCDYPFERLQILVASDGSTDETVQVVKRMQLPNTRTIAYRHRRGKVATLTSAIAYIDSEVVVFTDASNRFDSQALYRLANHFRDPTVGLVTGKVSMVDEHGRPAESLYWRSEMKVRQSEAELGIMLGASGAIYAVRRSMFVHPKRPIINDDLVIPMLVHLNHGCRFVFDETARAYVTNMGGIRTEFNRRCRIGSGAFQCLPVLKDLLLWRHRRHAFAFASHKLMRWACPFLLIALFFSNFALMAAEGYEAFLWIQIAAYSLAVAGLFAPPRGLIPRIARTASSFLFMNVALLVGFIQFAFDPRNVTWSPTPRPRLNELQPTEIKRSA